VPPEGSDGLTRVLLDRQPELPLDALLLGVRESHQDVVVDQLVIAQRLPGGVQALEDLLCAGLRPQSDRHVLEPLQTLPDRARLVCVHLAAEERVVVVEAGFAFHVVAPIEHHGFVEAGPGVMRAQLGAGRVVGAHEDALQLGRQLRVAVADRMVQRRDEQHDRRDPLLTVDEDQIVGGIRTRRAVASGQDGADEMTVPGILSGHRPDVGQQLLAPSDVPAVLALIDRDDDVRRRCGEPLDRSGRVCVDIGRRCHGCVIPPNGGVTVRRIESSPGDFLRSCRRGPPDGRGRLA
jgi:hypothetical protein